MVSRWVLIRCAVHSLLALLLSVSSTPLRLLCDPGSVTVGMPPRGGSAASKAAAAAKKKEAAQAKQDLADAAASLAPPPNPDSLKGEATKVFDPDVSMLRR